jgi:hypothetical protein
MECFCRSEAISATRGISPPIRDQSDQFLGLLDINVRDMNGCPKLRYLEEDLNQADAVRYDLSQGVQVAVQSIRMGTLLFIK